LLLQDLAQVLPERQLEVVAMLLAEEAYEQIAHELGIAVGTVKAHVFKVRNNPEVSEVLRPGSGLRPDGAHFRGRNHRK
jgi:DNA-directed RNA polymerase specialized sigma24 family protein